MAYIVGILNSVISLLSLFLICIILIQRGKGGGLAGAFGGVGGSSAFGTKAGDFFTRLTIGIAAGWIVLAMLLVILTNSMRDSAYDLDPATSIAKEFAPKAKDKSATADDKSGAVPPATPTPAGGSGAAPATAPAPAGSPEAAPAVDIPAIKELAPSKAAVAPVTPAPGPTTPAPAPTAPAATPKKP
jgi:preprotein translocase subunit SecG